MLQYVLDNNIFPRGKSHSWMIDSTQVLNHMKLMMFVGGKLKKCNYIACDFRKKGNTKTIAFDGQNWVLFLMDMWTKYIPGGPIIQSFMEESKVVQQPAKSFINGS